MTHKGDRKAGTSVWLELEDHRLKSAGKSLFSSAWTNRTKLVQIAKSHYRLENSSSDKFRKSAGIFMINPST